MAERSRAILVVEDDPEIRYLVVIELKMEGYQVDTAADGRQALEAIERRFPDLILLDLNMPVMGGWEFAREFHARYDRRAPIVLMSACCSPERHLLETGAEAWIGKPFPLEALLETVARWIEVRPATVHDPAPTA